MVNLPMLWSVLSASLLNGLVMLKPGMSSSRVLTPSLANSAAASALGASSTGYLQGVQQVAAKGVASDQPQPCTRTSK